MTNLGLRDWEREFRAAAMADHYSIFRDHLTFLDLPQKPALIMRGTINVVRACAAYAKIDGRPLDTFLRMQKYNPAKSPNARYMFTFDLHGKAFARVLVDSKIGTIDLADLYGHPWMDYKVVGYGHLWISRTDLTNLTKKEIRFLEEEVTNDLRFDYGEDELDFWFDDSNTTYLYARVQDHLDDKNEK